jgi:tRNA threonylcarbamoyladenosine biosynthesis protein TsaB
VKEDHSANSHSARITLLIEEALQSSGLSKTDLTGVIVADGPGSYTGLRIGASAAKALCFALNIPLMAESNLLATAKKSVNLNNEVKYHISSIDARRQDVYALIYSNDGQIIKDSALTTIDESFRKYLESLENGFCLSGNGADKIIGLLDLDSSLATTILNSARNLHNSAIQLFDNQVFKNALFYEPDYMQAPNIIKSKKLLR